MCIIDSNRLANLRCTLEALGKTEDIRRLSELADKETDHIWLWAVSRHRGLVLDAIDHIEIRSSDTRLFLR